MKLKNEDINSNIDEDMAKLIFKMKKLNIVLNTRIVYQDWFNKKEGGKVEKI